MSAKKLLALVGGIALFAALVFYVTAGVLSPLGLANNPGQVASASETGMGGQGWHTPPNSGNYIPVIATPGWRTPPTSNYFPSSPSTSGWRTPPMSKYYPPFIPTPGWRTPPTSNYRP